MLSSHAPTRRRFWWRLILIGLAAASAAAAPWALRQAKFIYRVRMARRALARFKADKAVTELTIAEGLGSGSAQVQYLLGVAYRKAMRLDEVRPHFKRAVQFGWPKKEVDFQLTLLAFQAGDRSAEAKLKRMAQRQMDDETAQQLYEALSLGYLYEYRVQDAMLVLDHWTEWQPDCVRPRLLRCEVFTIARQPVWQEAEYQEVLKIEPQNFAAHLGLAQAFQRRHDIQQALAHYQVCLQQSPGDPDVSAGIASCLTHQGKLAEAERVLKAVLERADLEPPQRAAALAALAEQEPDLDSAIKLLSEAIELQPYNPRLHYMLGVSLAKSGRLEEAKRHTGRSAELDRLWQRQSDLELEMAGNPTNVEARFELGQVMAKLGRAEPSAAIMQFVLRVDPDHSGAHDALARYYEATGQEDLARRHREATRRTDASDAQGAVAPSDAGLVRGSS